MKPPWTRAELAAHLGSLRARIERTEREFPDARPLPPMTSDECMRLFTLLMDLAATRPLALGECFLHGQLLQVLIQATRAETLKLKGRFFVIPEEQVQDVIERARAAGEYE